MKDTLMAEAARLGLQLTSEQTAQFCAFGEALIEKNKVMNLTAITEPQAVAKLHFADCLALLKMTDFHGKTVIDVGCGAGFPGVPLKIGEPSMKLTLLDSLQKRLTFLETVCREVDLPVTLIHARAEEGGLNPDLREKYDVACARAVAALPTLSEYCLPFVKVGGRFLALKGPDADRELEDARRGVGILGGKVVSVQALTIPATPIEGIESMERRLVHIEKVKHTPAAYPRHGSKIKKFPL
jgi:16S rRNA (guanine527-N7)-methyltransferase